MAYKHMGATTEQWRYVHTVRCLYSGSEGKMFTVQKQLSENDQERLNFKYMREKCECSSCVSKRNDRAKLRQRLIETNATKSLEAMGW